MGTDPSKIDYTELERVLVRAGIEHMEKLEQRKYVPEPSRTLNLLDVAKVDLRTWNERRAARGRR